MSLILGSDRMMTSGVSMARACGRTDAVMVTAVAAGMPVGSNPGPATRTRNPLAVASVPRARVVSYLFEGYSADRLRGP